MPAEPLPTKLEPRPERPTDVVGFGDAGEPITRAERERIEREREAEEAAWRKRYGLE